MKTNVILHRDALNGIRDLPDASVDCILTSPPYWSARDYGVPPTLWADGSRVCLGLEKTVEAYVRHLSEICDALRRVLKPTGTMWLNVGDTYAGSWGNYAPSGIRGKQRPRSANGMRWRRRSAMGQQERPPSSRRQHVPLKSLCMMPERVGLALVRSGWTMRNRIVWYKPNHMPASVKDRLTSTWEHLLLFTKRPRYFFDLDAIRVPHKTRGRGPPAAGVSTRPSLHIHGRRLPPRPGDPAALHPRGKNPGDLWTIALRSSYARHPAAFPEELCERPIRAGCPRGGIVLDPFVGSGTAAVVALRLGRRFIGLDQREEFVQLARQRLREAREADA